MGCPHFDTDDYHWFTDDALPYRRRRNPEHRLRLLLQDLDAAGPAWVLSGSLCGWGDALAPRFSALVYRWLPVALRVQRIRQREMQRYGPQRLAEGGDLHAVFEKFLLWAQQYDDAPPERPRSRAYELDWCARLGHPLLRLEADEAVEDLVGEVLAWRG